MFVSGIHDFILICFILVITNIVEHAVHDCPLIKLAKTGKETWNHQLSLNIPRWIRIAPVIWIHHNEIRLSYQHCSDANSHSNMDVRLLCYRFNVSLMSTSFAIPLVITKRIHMLISIHKHRQSVRFGAWTNSYFACVRWNFRILFRCKAQRSNIKIDSPFNRWLFMRKICATDHFYGCHVSHMLQNVWIECAGAVIMIIVSDWMESRIMWKKPENGEIKMNMHKLRTVGHCRQYDRYTKRRRKKEGKSAFENLGFNLCGMCVRGVCVLMLNRLRPFDRLFVVIVIIVIPFVSVCACDDIMSFITMNEREKKIPERTKRMKERTNEGKWEGE